MVSRTEALKHHLQHNLFPPINPKFIPYLQIALERAEAGDWDTLITIKGDREGDSLTVTVRKLVKDMRLEDFLDTYDPSEGLG